MIFFYKKKKRKIVIEWMWTNGDLEISDIINVYI